MENKSITHEQTGYTLLYYTGRAPLQLGKVEVRLDRCRLVLGFDRRVLLERVCE